MENERSEERELAELREVPEVPTVTGERLTGYAVVYGVPSAPITDRAVSPTPFVEVIDRGAFDGSVRGANNVTFVHKHDDDAEYGDTASKGLTLVGDDYGVKYDLQLPPYAHSLRGRVERKEYPGMSFKFRATEVQWKGGVRHVVKGKLEHISPVFRPAYQTPPPALVKPATNTSLYKAKALLLDIAKK